MEQVVAVIEKKDKTIDSAGLFLLEKAFEIAQQKHVSATVEIINDAQSVQVKEYAAALWQIIQEQEPALYLFAATQFCNELASTVAAGGEPCGLVCDAADIEWNEGEECVCIRRLATDGKSMMVYTCREDVRQLVTIKPQKPQAVFLNETEQEEMDCAKEEEKKRLLQKFEKVQVLFPVILDDTPEIIRNFVDDAEAVDIEHADYVFSGGRGIGGMQGYQKLETLAALCGAKTATSRANVDEGWISKERQVGLSGKVIAPKVYFAVGISGAAHHVIGIEEAEIVIAVNLDRNAPIFEVSDLGIVADGQKVLDCLIQRISKSK